MHRMGGRKTFNSFINRRNSFWIFLIIMSNLLPECMIFLTHPRPPPLGSYSWRWLALSWRLGWRCRWRRCIRTIQTALWWWLSAPRAPLPSQICECLREGNGQCGIRDKSFPVSFVDVACICTTHVEPVGQAANGNGLSVHLRLDTLEFLRFPSSFYKAGEPSHISVSRLTLLKRGTPTTKPVPSRMALCKDARNLSLLRFVKT